MLDIFVKSAKKNIGKTFPICIVFAVLFMTSFSQIVPPAPPPPISPKPNQIVKKSVSRIINDEEIPAEISVKTDASVNISLCVNEGKVKVNGWERSEVRAVIKNGSSLGAKVLSKNADNLPTWLKVLGYDPLKNKQIGLDECVSGELIELDVPRGATVNIKGDAGEYDAEISFIYRANVKSNEGNIFLNGIKNGVTAQTFAGDIEVGNSGGSILLSGTNTNISAYNLSPEQPADAFSAKTSGGAINLQSVNHSQVEAFSNSGVLSFAGEISGGEYNFGTQSGEILLTLSKNSSVSISANYAGGNFNSLMPIKNTIKTEGSYQKLTGVIGSGNASLNLKTYSGLIKIIQENK